MLEFLNIEETNINTLLDIEKLNNLEKLTSLRIGQTPLSVKFEQKQLREILIAYLWKIFILNSGKIDEKERISSERSFIRTFSDYENVDQHLLPKFLAQIMSQEEVLQNEIIFQRLHAKHGNVYKFAEVNLSPPKTATISIECETKGIQVQEVELKWTVAELKSYIEVLFDIPVDKQKLYHADHETIQAFGLEELNYNNVKLWACGIKTNDAIVVNIKK